MGYVGKQPTSVPLTSSDVTDGIITTAKIADDAVTTAKAAFSPGKILQVVNANFTTGFADTTINAWTTVTGYTASITPSSSSNKVSVCFNFNAATGGSGLADILRHFKVVKTISATTTDDSPIHTGSVGTGVASTLQAVRAVFDKNGSQANTIEYISSPSTTSAVTYSLQFYGNQTGSVFINRVTTNPSNLSEGASTITLMEISA